MSEVKTTQKTTKPRKPLAEYSPEEQRIIRIVERNEGRELTEQEAHFALEQARHIGEL